MHSPVRGVEEGGGLLNVVTGLHGVGAEERGVLDERHVHQVCTPKAQHPQVSMWQRTCTPSMPPSTILHSEDVLLPGI